MSIFYPDNDHRHDRLIQLASDAQSFLNDAKISYKQFLKLNSEVNEKIAAVYKKAGLTDPTLSSVDILKSEKAIFDIPTQDTIVEISKIVVGIGGVVATISYFAPAATAMLVETGVMEAETASAVLFSALGAEVTAGALAGGIIGGLIVGVVVVGIGLAIDAIEGAEVRSELRNGIYHTDQLRANTKYAADKSTKLVELLRSVKTTCDSLLSESIELTDAIIQNIIQKNAIPALKEIEGITKSKVLNELASLDSSRGSWTNEDESGKDIVLPISTPIYINAGVEVPQNAVPSTPDGLKLTALEDPENLSLKLNYPILKVNSVQYWPFSYIDNRVGMAIVAFDNKGNIVKRWDKTGARYVWKIEQDLEHDNVVFVGQSKSKILMKWSELTDITLEIDTKSRTDLCPSIPDGLNLFALKSPNTLDSADAYPILLINSVQYWIFSYNDNRLGMAIIAFDNNGNILKRWDKTGARYIYKIEQKLNTNTVLFIGQSNDVISMAMSELTKF